MEIIQWIWFCMHSYTIFYAIWDTCNHTFGSAVRQIMRVAENMLSGYAICAKEKKKKKKKKKNEEKVDAFDRMH